MGGVGTLEAASRIETNSDPLTPPWATDDCWAYCPVHLMDITSQAADGLTDPRANTDGVTQKIPKYNPRQQYQNTSTTFS